MEDWQYRYQATVVRVKDGDTAQLLLDLGFHISVEHSVRFYNYNAPELRTPEGKLAKAALELVIPPGTKVVFESYKDKPDKYGRLLGVVYLNGEPVVGQETYLV